MQLRVAKHRVQKTFSNSFASRSGFGAENTDKKIFRRHLKWWIFHCTVEPRYNEPPEVLGITNDFLCPSNSKIYEKEPRYCNKARYS